MGRWERDRCRIWFPVFISPVPCSTFSPTLALAYHCGVPCVCPQSRELRPTFQSARGVFSVVHIESFRFRPYFPLTTPQSCKMSFSCAFFCTPTSVSWRVTQFQRLQKNETIWTWTYNEYITHCITNRVILILTPYNYIQRTESARHNFPFQYCPRTSNLFIMVIPIPSPTHMSEGRRGWQSVQADREIIKTTINVKSGMDWENRMREHSSSSSTPDTSLTDFKTKVSTEGGERKLGTGEPQICCEWSKRVKLCRFSCCPL